MRQRAGGSLLAAVGTALPESMIAIVAIVAEQGILIDVAIALTLVGFLGAVAFARYMEKGATAGRPPD